MEGTFEVKSMAGLQEATGSLTELFQDEERSSSTWKAEDIPRTYQETNRKGADYRKRQHRIRLISLPDGSSNPPEGPDPVPQ